MADAPVPTNVAPPTEITDLVSRFGEHIDAYKSGRYNETQLRREFLDPFFIALGWDVNNEAGFAEAYKDVIHEDAIKVGGTTKAPDYSFRVGGQRKFFVEAKKPSVDVKGDPHPAYQLRRYAWSAKLPVSILTDFEEFSVYDCRVRPSARDKASAARIMYVTYEEYIDKWPELVGTFSKHAIQKGAFDKYAKNKKRTKGTAEVDDAFLEEMERWRKDLAQHLARNNQLSARQINHAVQLIIDRIVFLRICEDRGVEPAGTLQSLINGSKVYDRLFERFRHADAKYNSGLFHFERESGRGAPDTLTPSLDVGDNVLKDIIKHLYYPDAPYEFSVLPADILGHIYERFLGSVITLSKTGKTAKVEPKPEVRKAGGVYYTPTYIVDYIVEHTVCDLLKERKVEMKGRGKSRGPVMDKPLRVLDPACGSGSFLLGAYQYLLDWHLKWYIENEREAWAKLGNPPIAQRGEDWRLTTSERKRILTEHIFGVDIDAQAVEVTKLSLLLKVLEGENEQTLQPLLFAKERALPDLSDNIKCGNSLIGSDFYEGQQVTMFDEEEQYRINAFDWEDEFAEIMRSGGFDAVIGNPPWLMAGYYAKPSLEYLRTKYKTATGKFDLYYLFIERGQQLTSPRGQFGMIVPNKFFHTRAARDLRRILAVDKSIRTLIDFGDTKIFSNATNYSCILILTREANDSFLFAEANFEVAISNSFHVAASSLSRDLWSFKPQEVEELFVRVREASIPLESLVDRFGTGVQTGADRILVLPADEPQGVENALLRPIRRGRDVRRYRAATDVRVATMAYEVRANEFVIMDEDALEGYPGAQNYLLNHREQLSKRVWFGKSAVELSGHWYGMMYLDSYRSFARPHLLTPSLSDRANFALGDETLFVTGTAGVTSIIPAEEVREDIRYLLGLLNSRVLSFYAISHSPIFSGGYFKFSAPYLKKIPVRVVDFDDSKEVATHDQVVELVQSMLDMNKRLHEEQTLTPQERKVLEKRIAATDRQIDQLVYQLYNLTDEEIAIVEEATSG